MDQHVVGVKTEIKQNEHCVTMTMIISRSKHKGLINNCVVRGTKINYGTKIYTFLLSFSANRFEISASIVKWQLDETSQIFVGHPVNSQTQDK